MGDVEEVRAFNRFYTHHVGALGSSLLESPFTLTEVRVLYELAQHAGASAVTLRTQLGLDAGYLSRILQRFTTQGLVAKRTSATDARSTELRLSAKGEKLFVELDGLARDQVASSLASLAPPQRRRLLHAMAAIRGLLAPRAPDAEPYVLRGPAAGDLGWVVQRHGVLYAQEYGWDVTFEALVATIVADFAQSFDEARERCWIAERSGEPVGAVFVVAASRKVAKLRLLFVEPSARGLGIGGRLVSECVRFARQVGYRKLTLWTNDVLVSARRIYEGAGFLLVSEKHQRAFGHRLVSQTWELTL